MQTIDLTHFIRENMPVYPGAGEPSIIQKCTVEHNGYAEKLLSFYSHTGTHIDAPGHILLGANTLDKFDVSAFVGKGLVIDISKFRNKIVEKDDIEPYEMKIKNVDFVLFYADWARYWGQGEYFSGFPVLSETAASWISSFGLKGVGFDSISIDPVGDELLNNHRIVLGKNMIIIENLKNLDKLIGKDFIFSCMPLKIKDSDGSPVRAFAIYDLA